MTDERRRHPDASSTRLGRRELLRRAGVVGAAWAGLQFVGCSDDATVDPAGRTDTGPAMPADGQRRAETVAPVPSRGREARVLLAYFSRAGENYHNGGRRFLDVGNTQVVADLIRAATPVDVYRIDAADPYPDDYDETVARNVREQEADARPAVAAPLPDLDGYDTVLLGSGIWNVRPPMIMSTFLDGVDLTGKRLVPFVTYAVSGLGRTVETYAALAPSAALADALAVRGEEAAAASGDVRAWLRRLGLPTT